MMQTYDITLNNNNGEEITLKFRIRIKGQMAIEKKFKGETAMDAIMSAASDAEKMAYILTTALNFDGNDNTITDGMEAYDMLVDNGYAGQEQFTELLTNIALFSGIMSEKRKAQVDAYVKGTYDSAFAEQFGDDEKNMTQPSEK